MKMLKNQQIIDQLTLEQKAALMSGKTEWQTAAVPGKVPAMFMSDGPHGLRKQEGEGDHLGLNASVVATCFPTAATLANSWDPQVTQSVGRALGQEAKAHDVQVVLGPGMNTKRNPKCGRNFEYYSEDPQLAGTMAANEINGAKKFGVYSYMKHFAMNNQETNRMNSLNEWANEQSIRETYLKPFRMAVEDGHVMATMNAFNFIGDRWCGANSNLLNNVLRGEWGYRGLVETDYFVGMFMNSNAGLANGTDLMLSTNGAMGAKPQGMKNPTVVHQMRTASHNILYTTVNSNAYRKDAVKSANAVTLPWKKRLYAIDVALVVVLILLECLVVYLDKRKFRD